VSLEVLVGHLVGVISSYMMIMSRKAMRALLLRPLRLYSYAGGITRKIGKDLCCTSTGKEYRSNTETTRARRDVRFAPGGQAKHPSRRITPPCPPRRTNSRRLPHHRILPLALPMTIQRRVAALRGALDYAHAIPESRPEEDVRIREQALLERDDDELRAAEPRPEERADVLRVREVQRCVYLVEDVHRRRFELQQRHDQRERDQRPVVYR
jgi:hypothetical protein